MQIVFSHRGMFLGTFILICGCSSNSDSPNEKQVSRLFEVAEKGDIDALDLLLKDGVNINSHGPDKRTAALRALEAENKNVYAALLRHGANPNTVSSDGKSVMNQAALKSSSFWLEQALKYKGDPDLENTGNKFFPGFTPLFYAISEGRIENTKLLIKAGANLNHLDKSKTPPLLKAAGRGSYDIVYCLVEAGADFRLKDGNGQDLVGWLSERNERFVPAEDQKPWFRKTVDEVKKKGANFELLKE